MRPSLHTVLGGGANRFTKRAESHETPTYVSPNTQETRNEWSNKNSSATRGEESPVRGPACEQSLPSRWFSPSNQKTKIYLNPRIVVPSHAIGATQG